MSRTGPTRPTTWRGSLAQFFLRPPAGVLAAARTRFLAHASIVGLSVGAIRLESLRLSACKPFPLQRSNSAQPGGEARQRSLAAHPAAQASGATRGHSAARRRSPAQHAPAALQHAPAARGHSAALQHAPAAQPGIASKSSPSALQLRFCSRACARQLEPSAASDQVASHRLAGSDRLTLANECWRSTRFTLSASVASRRLRGSGSHPSVCSAMASTPKRRKFAGIVSIGCVSANALNKILSEARSLSLEDTVSTRTLQRAAFSEYSGEMVLELKLPLKAGGDFTWSICDPCRLVQRLVELSPALKRLFGKSPSSPTAPWALILSQDEITPGAVLRPDNRRKFSAFYFSFKQFGPSAVRSEEAWFPLCVLRSCVVEEVAGGLSCALRCLLSTLADKFAAGLVLGLESGPTMFFAEVQVHLGDEAALSRGLSVKGASGLKPCALCANVTKKGAGLAPLRPDRLIEITCTEANKFVLHSDETLWETYDHLEGLVGRTTVAQLDKRQKSSGLTLQPNCILSDRALRSHFKPVSSLYFDWMHTFLSNGIAAHELHVLLGACRKKGIADVWKLLHDFCAADWRFPKHQMEAGKRTHATFSPAREKAPNNIGRAGRLKC